MSGLDHARVAAALTRRGRALRHRGTTVACPVCGAGFDRFLEDVDRPDAFCWRCGAAERHRAQWLLLDHVRPELLAGAGSLLHFAPEHALREALLRRSRRDGRRYVTADLDQPGVDLTLDLTALALPDDAFDAVLCSHVLEHVPDDAAAMRELRRVTAPGGWCLIQTPLDLTRAETYEDPSITDPDARRRAFARPDHVRMYAIDIAQRLRAGGFAEVERIDPRAGLGAANCDRAAIPDWEIIWLCR